MAIQFRNASSASTFAYGVTVSKPADVVDGDLLLLHVFAAAHNAPSGWELLESSGNLGVYYRIADDEPASYTIGSSNFDFIGAGILAFYSDNDAEIVVDDSAIQSNSSGTYTFPAVTAVTDGGVACFMSRGGSLSFSPASGFTEHYDSNGPPARYAMSKVDVSGGSTGTITATSGGGTDSVNVTASVAFSDGGAADTFIPRSRIVTC